MLVINTLGPTKLLYMFDIRQHPVHAQSLPKFLLAEKNSQQQNLLGFVNKTRSTHHVRQKATTANHNRVSGSTQ